MAFLTFPRSAKALIGSKIRGTTTGVRLATPFGSHLDFDVTEREAAELADLFEGIAAAFRERVKLATVLKDEEAEAAPATEAVGSVEAREAFPDVDPHVVALPKVKRAYTKRSKK